MSLIHDISPLLSPRIAVWPGDVGFSREVSLAIDGGDNIDLSAIRTTVHLGAHTDAPNHYLRGGEGIAARDLDLYFGPCQVITATVGRGERVRPGDFEADIQAQRVLFRTDSYPDPDHFNEDFCSLSPELVMDLAASGVRLVGIDTPSIDPFSSKDLPTHAAGLPPRHRGPALRGPPLAVLAPSRGRRGGG